MTGITALVSLFYTRATPGATKNKEDSYKMAIAERDVKQATVSSLRQIEAELGVDYILSEIDELPARIRQQQEAVRAARQAVEQAQGEVEVAEATLTALIGAEVDERTGKAKFSNDTARRAELAKRKTTDPTYLEAAKRLAEAEEAASTAQFDLDFLENRFSSIRTAGRIVEKRLAILGGDN